MAIAFLFATALVVFEPFHLNEGLSDRGRDLFYSIAAFAYPTVKPPPKTVVVTISDDSLDGEPWPPSFTFHATALQDIADRGPKAIFVDMAMIDDRRRPAGKLEANDSANDPDLDFFLSTLQHIAMKTPIYLAAAPGRSAANAALPKLVELAKPNSNISFVGVQLGRQLGTGRAYELSDPSGLRPAAVALYEDLNPGLPRLRSHGDREQMDVWWAVPRTRFNCRGDVPAHACAMISQGVWGRLWTLMTTGVVSVFPDQDDLSKVDVPYAPTVDLADIRNGDAAPAVTPALTNAVVFYGGDIAMAGDETETPLQSSVPGVHIHAMAYDNLVTMRGHFIGDQPPGGLGRRQHITLLILLLAVATFAARVIATILHPRFALQPHLRDREFKQIDALVLIPLAIAISIFEFNVLRVGPGVWASVLVATVSGDLLATRHLTSFVLINALGRNKTANLASRTKPRWRR